MTAGYATTAERHAKALRLRSLQARLARVDRQLEAGTTGAIRYDISYHPARDRWYIDASWKTAPVPAPSLEELRAAPVVSLDVNAGHLAVAAARACDARAIVIEDLDFRRGRAEGRERHGNRPSRGRPGRAFRRLVADIPSGKLRDRLVQIAANAGLSVIVVDPAYTCRSGGPSTGSARCGSTTR